MAQSTYTEYILFARFRKVVYRPLGRAIEVSEAVFCLARGTTQVSTKLSKFSIAQLEMSFCLSRCAMFILQQYILRVSGGLVGGPRAHQDQFHGFESH